MAHQAGRLGDDGNFDNGKGKADLALGIAYDISSELSAEATLNPDFSQVEADVAQIDVNTTFALFFPEKRPFFQEGSDLFNTYFNAVYTRSINNPLAAAKLTWRGGSSSVAFLGARDENSIIILPFEEQSRFVEAGRSYSGILRVRRDLGNQSHLGLLATSRIFGGGGLGAVAGLDGQIRLRQSNSLRFQALVSHTEEVDNPALVPDSTFNASRFGDGYTAGLDGESFQGRALMANLSRNTAGYWGSVRYSELSPTYRADSGFEPQNNQRLAMANLGGILRFEESALLEHLSGGTNLARKWNFDGAQKDEWLNANLELRLRAAQTSFSASYLFSNELFRGIYFGGIRQAHGSFFTRPWNALELRGNLGYGHRIARHALVMGRQLDYSLSATVRPLDRLMLSASFNYTRSDDLESGARLFSQSVFWSRLSLQVTRELSLRLFSQYNDRWKTWDFDPLVTYRINAFTMFYIGSTHNYRDLGPEMYGREGWSLSERQFFMKLQYLFQI